MIKVGDTLWYVPHIVHPKRGILFKTLTVTKIGPRWINTRYVSTGAYYKGPDIDPETLRDKKNLGRVHRSYELCMMNRTIRIEWKDMVSKLTPYGPPDGMTLDKIALIRKLIWSTTP